MRWPKYSAIKKNGIMALAATRMDLKIIVLNEVSQKEKDMYHISLNVECDTNEFIYKVEADSQT